MIPRILKKFARRIMPKKGIIVASGHLRAKEMKDVSSDYPIYIKNSEVSITRIAEGCRIVESTCRGNITLGRFVSITGPSRVTARVGSISIGSFSSIAPFVTIQEHFHRLDRATSYFIEKNIFHENGAQDLVSKGDIVIEEDVWIGAGAVVLSGVTIGRGSVVGAGAIVTKDVPRYSIVVGNPARMTRSRFAKSTIEELEASQWWKWDVAKLKANKEFFRNHRE